VRAESLSGLHAILVDHAQGAKAHVRAVVIVGERERMERQQPAVVGAAALLGPTEGQLHGANCSREFARTALTSSSSKWDGGVGS
jgi:hypothetical protein